MDKIKNRISSFLDSLSEDCLYSDVSDSTLKFEGGLVITSTNYGDCHNAVACDGALRPVVQFWHPYGQVQMFQIVRPMLIFANDLQK